MKKKNGKKGMIIALLLFLIVPISIAFFVLKQNQSGDLRKGSVSSLTLIYGEKNESVDDEEEVEFFISLTESGKSISETVNPLSEYRQCQMIFHKINNDVKYVFYLSDSAKNCAYTDPDGNLFLISEAKAEKLLAHRLIGGYAVTYASFPTLELLQGETLFGAKEIEGEWNYIDHKGKEVPIKVSEEAENEVVLPQGEMLNFQFSLEPEFCSVTLQNEKGELLYSGDPEKMSLIDLETDAPLSLIVQCDWYKEDHADYHGSLTYSFDVYYDVPTECSINHETVSPGEEIIITIKHSSGDKIEVAAYFDNDGIEKVKEDGVWTIRIPVSASAAPGEYELVLMGKDVKETFKITIR